MYITYETAQWHENQDNSDWKYQYIKSETQLVTFPNILPKTEFMPTKLVRISDMKVVEGSHIKEGYCTLSYSWNQSGDSVVDPITGKEKRLDEGKHQLVFSPLSTLQHVYYKMQNNDIPDTSKHVLFEGIIQHMCQQFNIHYLWYDQMCINQDDKEERKREIRNMHRIYNNDYCTIALVPEFYVETEKDGKPSFNTVSDVQVLNFHIWGNYTASAPVHDLSRSLEDLNVQQILYHAHQRTSTREHDRVFALANLFPDFIDQINFDDDQPIEDLMIHFYGLLAKKDIGILFFKKYSDDYQSTIQHCHFLPSWTGRQGEHDIMSKRKTYFQNYKVIGKTMHLASAYITNESSSMVNHDALELRCEDLPPIPEGRNNNNNGDDDYDAYYDDTIGISYDRRDYYFLGLKYIRAQPKEHVQIRKPKSFNFKKEIKSNRITMYYTIKSKRKDQRVRHILALDPMDPILLSSS
ncbi:hypothetical protein BDA99DRAFT_577603 [Phascolomyces articulosus]|uniref:Heterokaryon incompatibility domain-containing protein n=1 Tax=Phascolomyces articulosus TaxID=60185 RepID=A0AAD5KBE4_9FUNG|nr:hypothetical protein BDA99DRAFT_577603 [Phascolomyces articulosus]